MSAVVLGRMTFTEARRCADEIKAGIDNIGKRLLELYEGEGWQVLGYANWRDCVQAEFGYCQSYAYRLLSHEEVRQNLIEFSPIGEKTILPTTESQARPLARLAPDQQLPGWLAAVDLAGGKQPTAKQVSETVQRLLEAERDIRQRRQDALPAHTPTFLAEKYSVIYADPPWRYEVNKTGSRAIENHYRTMALEEICALPVVNITQNDAALFLWTTAPKLEEAFSVINAWGFTYRSCAVWDKEKIGMGFWFRGRHELLLVARKGNFPHPPESIRIPSVYCEPRTEHSKKPVYFREYLERSYPGFPKIELFCREPAPGWAAWGNQLAPAVAEEGRP